MHARRFWCCAYCIKRYRPKNLEYIKEKGSILDNAEKCYDRRKLITDALKNKVFPFTSRGQEYEDKEYEGK